MELEIPEKPENQLTKRIGLAISVMAVLLAVNSILGNQAETDELVSRVQASNTWAHYQAKRIRSNQTELTQQLMDVLPGVPGSARGNALTKKFTEQMGRYKSEGEEISAQAKALEAKADRAEKQGDWHDLTEVLLQLGVVLCSVSILADQRLFARIGLGIASFGLAAGVYAALL